MTGEVYALLAAAAYGVAGVTIVRSKASARGDNGVFLSVVATAALTWALWFGWGEVPARTLLAPESRQALVIFALAGLFSTVLGRVTMYRATERIGAVRASLLRRLTPVFALLCALVLLAEVPDARTIIGGAIILAGVMCYWQRPRRRTGPGFDPGLLLGIGSAFFYALAYTMRSLGLDTLPDAAFGTFIGALVGSLWFFGAAVVRRGPRAGVGHLLRDHGRWHCATALALSVGQTLQFFALKSAPVSIVAVLGTLEVFFSAGLVMVFAHSEPIPRKRLALAATTAAAGTAILFA
ncbi:MAG: DMT family transporter [Marivita sp.]|uniref:DMT family transporter n=1 Tax=Marivita sp. TaxID=2003365 RepID=UPI0025BC7904|nr:DMT family transporter [Marivita sp.]MCI5112297.1 DMT family transporter [Marivita sp.]